VGFWFTIALMKVVFAVLMLLPFVWLVSSALMSHIQIFQDPPQWIPNPDSVKNSTRRSPTSRFCSSSETPDRHRPERDPVVSTSSYRIRFARIRSGGADFSVRDRRWDAVLPWSSYGAAVHHVHPPGLGQHLLPMTAAVFFGRGAFNVFQLRQFFRTIPRSWPTRPRIDGCGEFGLTGGS
jgi:multiple sugar transport system permease protein